MLDYYALSNNSSDLQKTAEFLNLVMKKKHFCQEELRWRYFYNPDGCAIAINALFNGEIVGHYAAQPMKAVMGTRQVKGLFILNAAVDPRHQGKGILRSVADKVHEEASKQGYCFMIGVGNRNSTPIYTKSFKFTNQGPLTVKIGIGLPKRISGTTPYLRRLWTKDSIQWRLAKPNNCYQIVEDGNQCAVLYKYKSIISIYMGHFERVLLDGHQKFTKLSLPLLYIGCDPYLKWEKRTYIDFPERLKPSPLILITRNIQKNMQELHKDDILVQCLDIDAF